MSGRSAKLALIFLLVQLAACGHGLRLTHAYSRSTAAGESYNLLSSGGCEEIKIEKTNKNIVGETDVVTFDGNEIFTVTSDIPAYSDFDCTQPITGPLKASESDSYMSIYVNSPSNNFGSKSTLSVDAKYKHQPEHRTQTLNFRTGRTAANSELEEVPSIATFSMAAKNDSAADCDAGATNAACNIELKTQLFLKSTVADAELVKAPSCDLHVSLEPAFETNLAAPTTTLIPLTTFSMAAPTPYRNIGPGVINVLGPVQPKSFETASADNFDIPLSSKHSGILKLKYNLTCNGNSNPLPDKKLYWSCESDALNESNAPLFAGKVLKNYSTSDGNCQLTRDVNDVEPAAAQLLSAPIYREPRVYIPW